MNDFLFFFTNRERDDINKWSNYFEIYERYFSAFRNKSVRFLEIGVDRGGSSEMWKYYFGNDSVIVGVDINPECKKFENLEQKRFVEIGDQGDPEFLKYLVDKYGRFDIILDDGSHFFHHQIKTLELLWDSLTDNGVYLVEDVHTSYYPGYHGWRLDKNNFMEYSKTLTDDVNRWHCLDFVEGNSMADLYAVHYYSGIVIFEKKKKSIPYTCRSGGGEACDAVKAAAYAANYAKMASLFRVLSWYVKVIYYCLIGDKTMCSGYRNSLKARTVLKNSKRHD